MSLEVTGKLIEKFDTTQVNDRFRKREFVLELAEEINGNVYTNFAKMQLVQTKCDILDRFNIGDNLKVNFNIKGNRWERDGRTNYITNLDVWRIENVTDGGNSSQGGAGSNQGGYNNNQGGYNNNQGNYGNSNQGGGYNQGGNNFGNSGNFAPAGNNANMGNSAQGADNNDDLPF